jgi:hypothetical protein
MNPRVSNQKSAALTLVEVLVVICVIAVLAAVLLPALAIHHTRLPIRCVDNLKQIGLAYRVWAGDNNDTYPMQVSITNGGTMELTADGRNAWLNFLVMSNELVTPKLLVCPQDNEHLPSAINFSSQLVGHISYFVGLDAEQKSPAKMVLTGDDNLLVDGKSIPSGLLNLSTNASVAWTKDRHDGNGFVALTDGSVQPIDGVTLQWVFQTTGFATNRLAIP